VLAEASVLSLLEKIEKNEKEMIISKDAESLMQIQNRALAHRLQVSGRRLGREEKEGEVDDERRTGE
jgi:hypothetical protein